MENQPKPAAKVEQTFVIVNANALSNSYFKTYDAKRKKAYFTRDAKEAEHFDTAEVAKLNAKKLGTGAFGIVEIIIND